MNIYTFQIKVFTLAKKNLVTQEDDKSLRVLVTVAPEKGKANKKVIELLAEFFQIAKYEIVIVSGFTTRIKRIEINTNKLLAFFTDSVF